MRNDLAQIQSQLEIPNQTLSILLSKKNSYEKRLKELEEFKAKHLKAQALLDAAISKVSEGGINRIEEMVTTGLRLTFPDKDLKFLVEKKTGARGNSYRFVVSEGEVSGPAVDTFGGGVVNVTQFLLRVIMIQRFGLAKFLALDETFGNLSEGYLQNILDLFQSLVQEGFEILLITHQPSLAGGADRVYEVGPGPQIQLQGISSNQELV
jgi:DNA repair exonuclease SbcCD ATPase subunit